MKDISINSILDSMNADTAYLTDMWERCVDEKRKRYARNKFSSVLDKMEKLGYLKKQGYKTEITYTKLQFQDTADHMGFINDIIFTNESLIKKSLKKLDSKKIFIDISKDLNSQKFNNSITNMVELSSSIMLTIENTDNVELKKELKSSFKEIKEFLDESNEILMKFRGSNERIVLQRILNNRIPKPGCLKI